jgi:lipid-A-disaccharide synthase-like uncharacterized protein
VSDRRLREPPVFFRRPGCEFTWLRAAAYKDSAPAEHAPTAGLASEAALHSPVAAKKIRCDRLRMQSLLAILQVATLEINAWKIIGWTGNLIFGLRFVWQWIASERAKKSIIPPGFWEISLLGSMIYTSYFIFYRHDSVGIISNLLPLPLYARNVFLHWRHARNDKKVQESAKEEDSVVD